MGMTRRDRSRCPQCGERVAALAAGCAICGADLPKVSGPVAVLALILGYLAFYFFA
jgi:anaerobic ribonucleoside-triphosphate reductase